MRHLYLSIILLSLLAGCAGLMATGEANTTLLDEDGDGTYDVAVYTTPDGLPTTAEVPGSRAKFEQAGAIDADLASIAQIAGVILGVPGIALVGGAIGRLKPTKRLNGIVHSVQKLREAAEDGPLTQEQSAEILHEAQQHIAGLEAAIRKAKGA